MLNINTLKIGDKIIGNEKANERYSQTREGWIGIVTEINSNGTFNARGEKLGWALVNYTFYCLSPVYFDLAYQSSAEELVRILKIEV